jgi:ribose transport system substrate-binding protein
LRVLVTASALALSVAMMAGGVSDPVAASSKSGTVSSGLVNAAKVVAEYEKLPTSVGISTSLKATPATGKTLVYLQCDLPQCAVIEQLIATATAAVKWNLKVVNFQSSNPATFTAALNTALQYHPVAVSFVAIDPYSVWSSSVSAYKAAGVALIPLGGMDTPTNGTIVRNVDGRADIELQARALADWFIINSHGHGDAVFWTVPQAPAIDVTQEAFSAEVKKNCPDCTINVLQQSLPDVAAGDAPATIVSALRDDPDAKYLILGNIVEAAGFESALEAADVTGIKIAGFDAGATDQIAVKQGTESGVVPFPLAIPAWQVVDAALRFSEHMGVPHTSAPFQLLTSSSMASTRVNPTNAYPYPSNYQSTFKRLWKVS